MDRITANLPARSTDDTAAFYERLGFVVGFKDDGWLILKRGSLEIEFFAHPELDPRTSCFSACIRVDDLDALYADFCRAGLPADCWSVPRLTPPAIEPHGMRIFALIDLDGSLLRCIDNKFQG
ncbi:MAG: bleomycin resistance protein [Hyphomonadaceae bacterium]|nr:bleomycin resistance protein [Hyphomonadaceae bacterium]